jgi:hypothetical protein
MQFGRTYEESHHPLHLDANYAGQATDFGRNVVVGNYIYSLLLGMSVPDVSGKAIANLEVETRGYKQDGTLVRVFRRKVMVSTETYIKERGGEQPGRPEPAPLTPAPPFRAYSG